METNSHAEIIMKRTVEITVSAYTEQRLLLTATTYQGEVLAKDISFDDLFDREDLRPINYITPLDRDIPETTVSGLRREVAELVQYNKDLRALRDERSSTCNSARYKELESADGPLRLLEEKVKIKGFVIRVMLRAATGVWPHQFRDLEIN